MTPFCGVLQVTLLDIIDSSSTLHICINKTIPQWALPSPPELDTQKKKKKVLLRSKRNTGGKILKPKPLWTFQ